LPLEKIGRIFATGLTGKEIGHRFISINLDRAAAMASENPFSTAPGKSRRGDPPVIFRVKDSLSYKVPSSDTIFGISIR
jgi:hypothetical protein